MAINEPADQEQEEQSTTSVSAAEWLRFIMGASKRHVALGVAAALVIAVLGVTVAIVLPPTYEASSKILVAQNAAVTPMLSNPSRSMPTVDPMRGVSEIVMRRENLESIIEEAKLVDQWAKTRDLPHRLKDTFSELVSGPVPRSEVVKALVTMLETALSVRPEDSVSIRIHVLWRDPVMAQAIAKLALKKFFDARGNQEKAPISAAIEILEDELKKAGEAIEPEFANVGRAREKARGGGKKADAGVEAAPAGSAPPVMQYVRSSPTPKPAATPNATLSAKLAEIRAQQREIQEPWQRQLQEARAKLAEEQNKGYGPAHPSIVQQEARVQAASVEPPTLVNLRQEERDLLAQIQTGQLVGDTAAPAGGHWVARPATPSTPGAPAAAPMLLDEDPEVAAARAKLMSAISKYTDVKEHLDAARIELTTAETAFKFRYIVVAEPELPRKPVKPNRPILILGSIAAALLAGFVAGAIRELLTGRVIEPFQVKQLGLPLLADVTLPGPQQDS
jgi:polysaccharide biosynthesis transport protein